MAKKRGAKTAAQLKKELDQLFSRWVRLSHADSEGFVVCYTCGARKFWKEIQNGHFISRQYLATRFDPRNTRPQCPGCNLFGNGRQVEFAAKLEAEKKGITLVLYREAQKIVKGYPYEEEIDKYKKKLQKFKKFL